MERDLARRAHAMLMEALEFDDPARRRGFVERSCGENITLRRRVLDLLRAVDDSGRFLEEPALKRTWTGTGSNALESLPAPTRIGRYSVVRILGEGGMATVYEATQESPARRVALKVLRRGLRDATAAQRFQFETEVLARLSHPGIAQIYEAGTFETVHHGHTAVVPFFAMEFVEDALPLTAYLDRRFPPGPGSVRARLELFAAVCDAVHHGHQRGVIHRDLKPGNVLVDGAGRAKVIDFGIARPADPEQAGITSRTDAGQLLGTLNYVSPEQCEGGAAEMGASVDPRTDVYSLGVVLYEILCGKLPHDLAKLPITGALRVIREGMPERPSAVRPWLRGDLESIVLRAIEKDRDRRYASAGDLAEDVRRFLRHEPVRARPASAAYRFRRFARRNPGLITGLAAAVLALAAGAGVALIKARDARIAAERERTQRIRAEWREIELEKVARFQAEQFARIDAEAMGRDIRESIVRSSGAGGAADPEPLWDDVNFTDLAVRTLDAHILQRALAAAREEFAGQPLILARLLQNIADSLLSLGLASEALAPQEEALDIRRRALGDDDPATLESIGGLGYVYEELGRNSEAEPLHAAAYEGRRRVLGEDHRLTLESMARLGAVLHKVGRVQEAEPYFKGVLEAHHRVGGELTPGTLTAANNFGVFLQVRGRPVEAEPYITEALRGFRATLGDDDPLTMASMNSLGELLSTLGRTDEALALTKESYERRRRVLGIEHPETLRSMTNLGMLYQGAGRLDEAGVLLREALAIRRRTLQDDHNDTIMSILNVGSHERALGNLEAALPLYEEALERRRRVSGPEHRATLFTMAAMGVLLQELGRSEEAERLQREALDGRERTLGPEHPDTLGSYANMCSLLRKMGRAAEAEEYGRIAVERTRRALPAGHPRLGRALGHHAAALVALDRHAEAEPLALEAFEIAEKAYKPGDSTIAAAAAALADLYESWDRAHPGDPGRASNAASWRAKADAAGGASGAEAD